LVNVVVFTVEINCFCPGSPSCWHWFWRQGCTRQVLLVGLRSTIFIVMKVNIFSWGGAWL
jgi:hypothetical protein